MCSNHLVHDGKYFTKEKPTLLKEVTLIPDKPAEEADNAKLAQATKFGALLGEGTVNARSWANEQLSELDPRGLELLCRQICDRDNIEISVLQAPELSKESLGLLAAVGSGAACPPRLIVMTYMWGCRGGIT